MESTFQININEPFDLKLTLECGQAFRWYRDKENWFTGVIDDNVIKVKQEASTLSVKVNNENFSHKQLNHLFALDHDLPFIYRSIGRDAKIRKIIKRYNGLRIIRQDPWECLISYIISTRNSIPRIRNAVQKLSELFGSPLNFKNETFHTFPTAKNIAKASIHKLQLPEISYRAKFIKAAAMMVYNEEIDFKNLRTKSYEETSQQLQTITGVGWKVSDCTALFALEFLQAFPVDRWIHRAMHRLYPTLVGAKHKRKFSWSVAHYRYISKAAQNYFGKYAGYAEEYLFVNERLNTK